MELKAKRPRIVFNCPEQLKTEFKAATAINNEEMTSVLYKFVKAYTYGHRAKLEYIINKYRNKEVPVHD